MSIEHLLIDRYKVIANYPKSGYKIGDILYADDKGPAWIKHEYGFCTTPVNSVADYPHLFKKLEWWEDRAASEMPEYFKWIDTGVVCKYHKHIGAYFYLEDDNSFGYALANTIPATEADYQAYLMQKEATND